MSLDATRWAWATPASHGAKLVLLALADCHNKDTGLCCPSVQTLGRMTGLSRTSVMEAIHSLESLGLLSVDRRPGLHSNYKLPIQNQSSNPTGSVSGPVQKLDGTSPVPGPDPSSFRTHNRKEPETTVAVAPFSPSERISADQEIKRMESELHGLRGLRLHELKHKGVGREDLKERERQLAHLRRRMTATLETAR